jgi:hypothetical protein
MLWLLVLVMVVGGCDVWEDGSVTPDEVVTITGTVQYLEIEGGVWTIEGTTSNAQSPTTYQPINLPKSFRVDGQKVRVRARIREDMVSFQQVGPIIDIQRIEGLE